MTDQHRATPEQWADAGAFASDTRSCLFELRARVEALEGKYETQRLATLEWGKDVDRHDRWIDDHLKRIMALEAATNDRQHGEAVDSEFFVIQGKADAAPSLVDRVAPELMNPPLDEDDRQQAPADLLVERVADVFSRDCAGQSKSDDDWKPEARAAIREVAAWLDERYPADEAPDVAAVAAAVARILRNQASQ